MYELKEELQRIFNTCTHDIVIKYHNHYPRLSEVDGNYYCPMCRKSIGTHSLKYFMDSAFSNSRIIELNIDLDANSEVLFRIRNEVMDNYDLFYNSSATNEELASRLEDRLRDVKHGYFPLKKI